jgi:hypothetical protein
MPRLRPRRWDSWLQPHARRLFRRPGRISSGSDGRLIVLDGLRICDDGGVKHGLVLDLASSFVSLLDKTVDRRAVRAPVPIVYACGPISCWRRDRATERVRVLACNRVHVLRNCTGQMIGLANMAAGSLKISAITPSDLGCTDAEFLHLRMVDYALGEGLCPGCARRFRGHRWRETFK